MDMFEKSGNLAVVIRRIHPNGEHESIIACTDASVVRATIRAIAETLCGDQGKVDRESNRTDRVEEAESKTISPLWTALLNPRPELFGANEGGDEA